MEVIGYMLAAAAVGWVIGALGGMFASREVIECEECADPEPDARLVTVRDELLCEFHALNRLRDLFARGEIGGRKSRPRDSDEGPKADVDDCRCGHTRAAHPDGGACLARTARIDTAPHCSCIRYTAAPPPRK